MKQSSFDINHEYEIERQLASLWQEVLGIEQVGLHDDFFALGGDSLKAVDLVYKLQELASSILHPTALFAAPTVSLFAAYLNEYYPEVIARFQDDAYEKINAATDEPKEE